MRQVLALSLSIYIFIIILHRADNEVLKVTAAVIWRGVISSKLSPRLGHIMVKSGHTGFSAAEVSFWERHQLH